MSFQVMQPSITNFRPTRSESIQGNFSTASHSTIYSRPSAPIMLASGYTPPPLSPPDIARLELLPPKRSPFPSIDESSLVYTVREDSLLLKLLACIPLIGIIPAELAVRSLRGRIKNTNNAEKNIVLLKIINVYKAYSVLRAALTVALAVTALSYSILTAPIAVGCVVASSCNSARNIYGRSLNVKLIRVLAATIER